MQRTKRETYFKFRTFSIDILVSFMKATSLIYLAAVSTQLLDALSTTMCLYSGSFHVELQYSSQRQDFVNLHSRERNSEVKNVAKMVFRTDLHGHRLDKCSFAVKSNQAMASGKLGKRLKQRLKWQSPKIIGYPKTCLSNFTPGFLHPVDMRLMRTCCQLHHQLLLFPANK